MHTGRRAKNDRSCALCPNVIEPYRWYGGSALCETCHKEHSPVSAYEGWKGEVMFYGCVGSGWDIGDLFPKVRNTDEVFTEPAQYSRVRNGNKRFNA